MKFLFFFTAIIVTALSVVPAPVSSVDSDDLSLPPMHMYSDVERAELTDVINGW